MFNTKASTGKQLDLYFWPTPNSWKITILLEELGVPYNVIPVNIAKGDQLSESYEAISPNNRIPAITDHDPAASLVDPLAQEGGFSVFESGAILLYLADKYGNFFPLDPRNGWECKQWLFWQVGGLGPMGGQAHHFRLYSEEKIPYGIDRYTRECQRLYAVLDKRLSGRQYICEQYSIADMACLPWIYRHPRQGIELEDYPALTDWYQRLMARNAVNRGFNVGEGWRTDTDFESKEARNILFGNSGREAEKK